MYRAGTIGSSPVDLSRRVVSGCNASGFDRFELAKSLDSTHFCAHYGVDYVVRSVQSDAIDRILRRQPQRSMASCHICRIGIVALGRLILVARRRLFIQDNLFDVDSTVAPRRTDAQ
jgi:hypothetical protein